MIHLFPRLLLVSVLSLLWQAAVAAPPHSDDAVAGMLVLRNGNVLSGHVIRLQDHYQLAMPNGQLQVPVDQVELFCHSLDEAYAERRRVRTGSTADSHLELARWCLRHRLYEHASRELLDARAIDPEHRKLAMLERQLQHLQQTETQRPNVLAKRATESVAQETRDQHQPKPARHVPQRVPCDVRATDSADVSQIVCRDRMPPVGIVVATESTCSRRCRPPASDVGQLDLDTCASRQPNFQRKPLVKPSEDSPRQRPVGAPFAPPAPVTAKLVAADSHVESGIEPDIERGRRACHSHGFWPGGPHRKRSDRGSF